MMAEIFPFVAYRYNTQKVALENVLTQPYDKITPEMQERYYAASPSNLIAVEKGKSFPEDGPENNVYTRAAQQLEEWISQGILLRDASPSIYVYSQEYVVPEVRVRRIRQGFIALGRLVDYSEGVVYRHEHTLAAPKADRMELLRKTRTQTGLLFMLYEDPSMRVDEIVAHIARGPAAIELRDEYEVVHRLWPVSDPAATAKFVAAMADKKLIIADGHHRYETALAYRDECRAKMSQPDPDAPHEKAMMTFFNTRSRGLTILPTHRLISNIKDFHFEKFRNSVSAHFDWYAYPFTDPVERASAFEEFRKDLEGRHSQHSIGIYAGGDAFYLFLLRRPAELDSLLPDLSAAQRQLDVVLLHRLMLEKGLGINAEALNKEKNVSYEREMDRAILSVDEGAAQMACLLNPVRVEQVAEIALAADVLPQKSTDFYPKLLSGLAIYRLDG
jgi:uncharacterized protein (DUF1015 family)